MTRIKIVGKKVTRGVNKEGKAYDRTIFYYEDFTQDADEGIVVGALMVDNQHDYHSPSVGDIVIPLNVWKNLFCKDFYPCD